MADVTLYAGETRLVNAAVTADTDPTDDQVFIAFVLERTDPTDDDWNSATWHPSDTWSAGGAVRARILVGPDGGDVALEPGTYDMVVRVDDQPESPWMKAGTVLVRRSGVGG